VHDSEIKIVYDSMRISGIFVVHMVFQNIASDLVMSPKIIFPVLFSHKHKKVFICQMARFYFCNYYHFSHLLYLSRLNIRTSIKNNQSVIVSAILYLPLCSMHLLQPLILHENHLKFVKCDVSGVFFAFCSVV
jgi:hypothetical protein